MIQNYPFAVYSTKYIGAIFEVRILEIICYTEPNCLSSSAHISRLAASVKRSVVDEVVVAVKWSGS